MPIAVEVVSQERKLFEYTDADMVLIPGSEGQLGILPNHSPLITLLAYGELVIRKGGAEETFAIYGGVADIRPDKVLILADSADFTRDLSLREAEEARERVARRLQEMKELPSAERENIILELRRAELAVNLARKSQGKAPGLGLRVVKDAPKKEE